MTLQKAWFTKLLKTIIGIARFASKISANSKRGLIHKMSFWAGKMRMIPHYQRLT
jgi:hypothetical protein